MLWTVTFVLSLLILSQGAHGSFSSITSKLQDVLFEYPGPAVSERDLPICQPHSVCSIIHRRFWSSPVVERLCRCLRRLECPWQWTDPPDNLTMVLDNRSQLKFCDTVTLLPECEHNTTALKLTVADRDEEPGPDAEGPKMDVKVSCYCPSRNQWEHQSERESIRKANETTTTTSHYTCKPLNRCDTYEFCGHLRADYYSTYYHCTCPMGHLCINNDRKPHNASELLYTGPVLKAYCVPNP